MSRSERSAAQRCGIEPVEEAIARARRGDPAAYEGVVREFQGRLRAFVAAYCPARDQVDEIVQRAFVWAYRHLDEYKPGTRFYAWLKAIARNHLLADLEVQKREARGRQRYLEFLLAARCREELAREPEDRTPALRACLDELPPGDRALVAERYEAHRPVEAMARDGGCAAGALRVALFRVRQRLRRCVEGKMAEAAT